MRIVCLDLEGVLVPEIWVALAHRTQIKDFLLTTRDIKDYDELMSLRLKILKKEGLTIEDIYNSVKTLDPFDGAKSFLNKLTEDYQVIILSDTYYEIAQPLFQKLGFPNVFCHHLQISKKGVVEGYKLRLKDQKRKAVEAFQNLGFSVSAAGDSYNDLGMLEAAEIGVLFRAPNFLIEQYKLFSSTNNYEELYSLLTQMD